MESHLLLIIRSNRYPSKGCNLQYLLYKLFIEIKSMGLSYDLIANYFCPCFHSLIWMHYSTGKIFLGEIDNKGQRCYHD